MRRYTMWLPLLLLLAAACANETTNPGTAGTPDASIVQVGDTVELRPGRVVNIGDSGIQLVFREVAEDSRCPINVVCVWAGNAAVILEARLGQSAWKRLTVNTGVEPRAADYGAYRFHLVMVQPAREEPHVIAAADYRATVAIAGR